MTALHKNSLLTAVVLLILGVAAVVVWRATADTVIPAGFDVFETPPGSGDDDTTHEHWDLPAGFFDDGSLRSDAQSVDIYFRGGDNVPGFAGDTVVTRLRDVTVPGDNQTGLELHGLRLASVAPVRIFFENGTVFRDYNVSVRESTITPSGGTMTFFEGGTFTNNLDIHRAYTLTSPGQNPLEFDSSAVGWPPVRLTAEGNWEIVNGRVRIIPRRHTAPSHSHFVRPPPTKTKTVIKD